MTLDDTLVAIARFVLGDSPTDDEALALVVLLHTHRLKLAEPVSDRPGVDRISALTQRHACEVVARAWPEATRRDGASFAHWTWQFHTLTPLEVVEDSQPPWDARVGRARERVLRAASSGTRCLKIDREPGPYHRSSQGHPKPPRDGRMAAG